MRNTCLVFFTLLCCLNLHAQKVPELRKAGFDFTPVARPVPHPRSAAVNICDTWTFQLQLSSTISEQPSDVVELPTGSYVVAGNDSSVTGKNGRLLKLGHDGTLLLSKVISLTSEQLTLQRMKITSGGRLYAIGTMGHMPGNLQPVLLEFDTATLMPVSVQVMAISNVTDWKGVDLDEGANNFLFLLSANPTLLNVTKVNMAGNTIDWSRTYQPRNAPRAIGIGIDQIDVFVSWNETDSGYSKGAIMALYQLNGLYRFGSRVGGLGEQINYEFQSMTVTNLRPSITGLQWKNNIYNPVRLNFEPTAITSHKEIYSIGGFTASPGMRSQQNQLSQVLAYQMSGSQNDVSLVGTWPDNYNSPIRSWRLNYGQPAELNRVLLTNDGGNLVIARTNTWPQRMIISKTDSIASLPGCNISNQTASFQFLPFPYKQDTIPITPEVFQLYPLVTSVADDPITVTEDCRSKFCPAPPQLDSCLRTFFKEYRNNSNTIVSRNQVEVGAGKFLLLSSSRTVPYENWNNAEVTIMDTSGKLLDSRYLESLQTITLITLNRLHDGNLLATGFLSNGSNPSDIYLIKFDDQYSIIWQKKMVTLNPPDFNGIEAVLETSEGDIYCYLRDRISHPMEIRTLLKLNASGNPVWMQQYTIGGSIFPQSNEWIPDLVEMGDGIVMKYNDDAGDFSPYLMRVKKTDGSIDWTFKYQMPPPYFGSNSFVLNKMVTDGNNIYLSGISQERNVLLKIRQDGSVALARHSPANSIWLGWLGLKSGGRLMSSAGQYSPGGYINGVVEMDTSFNILRTQYMQVPKFGRGSALMVYSDSVTYSTGNLWHDNPYWGSLYFQKYNFNSSFASCEVNQQLLVLDTFLQATSPKTNTRVPLTVPQMIPFNATFRTADLAYSAFYCGNNSSCSSFTLQGPQTICDTSNTYDYTATRNAQCNGMVLWNLDTLAGQVKIISSSGNLLRIKMRSGGTFKIRAKVFASCGWLEDSVSTQATAGATVLNLGQDVTICPGNTVVLNAHRGFGSYLWQDGSTDSVLTVTQPGLYFVQVTSCGNILKDSVLVNAAPPIPFNAGADRTRCNNDTIHLSAPAGFMNYTWSNNYFINSTTSQVVVVNPLVDTAYYVKAEKTPGCFAWDTVRVTVRQSPPVQLGADRSFCQGDSVSFDAGGGFAQYLWSNGQSSQQITVKSTGSYSVTASTVDGCKSYDTVKVVNVYPLPVVQLDQDPDLCAGSGKTLSAGNFVTYAWNTGASSPSIIVNDIGLYAVTVTDANGCSSSDTSIITTIHPLPAAFLPADTLICSYSTLEIKSNRNFQQYLWSTGRNTPSVSVTQPGLYWLEVTDDKNCKGRDSITVNPKDCMKGFYIPSAFTPNGDRLNDDFKPLLFGVVKKYLFTIYNRWGEVIFQTTELLKGWDGKLRGQPLRSDVFVWTCTYQFEGDTDKSAKGTVILIR